MVMRRVQLVAAALFAWAPVRQEAGALQDGAHDGAPAASPSLASPAAVRAAWEELAPEEREQIARNWKRWRAAEPEEREVLQRRHQRLQRARLRERERARDEARAPSRRELTRRALAGLRDTWESLPPELRRHRDGPRLPPLQRQRQLKRAIGGYLEEAAREKLRKRVERGELPAADVERLHLRLRRDPDQRAAALREFIATHPHAFR